MRLDLRGTANETGMLSPGVITAECSGPGGISYGPFKFMTSVGMPERFTDWLNSQCHPYGRILATWPPGTREFSAAWIYIANNDPAGFLELQRSFLFAHSDCRCNAQQA